VDWQHLFTTWGIAWWVLTLALLIGSIALVACKRGAYFLLSIVVYLGLLQFLGNTPVLEFVQTHFLAIAGVVAGFLGVAVVWFNWRWHWLTSKMRGRYNEVFAAWCHQKGIQDLPPCEDESEQADALRIEWEDYFGEHNHDEFGRIEFRPKFRQHKDAILTWMAAWPLDVLVWLVTEVLRDFWLLIYFKSQGLLQSIMERNWRGTEAHMLSPEQRAAWEAGRGQRQAGGERLLGPNRKPQQVRP
jgi:hypothetical protein